MRLGAGTPRVPRQRPPRARGCCVPRADSAHGSCPTTAQWRVSLSSGPAQWLRALLGSLSILRPPCVCTCHCLISQRGDGGHRVRCSWGPEPTSPGAELPLGAQEARHRPGHGLPRHLPQQHLQPQKHLPSLSHPKVRRPRREARVSPKAARKPSPEPRASRQLCSATAWARAAGPECGCGHHGCGHHGSIAVTARARGSGPGEASLLAPEAVAGESSSGTPGQGRLRRRLQGREPGVSAVAQGSLLCSVDLDPPCRFLGGRLSRLRLRPRGHGRHQHQPCTPSEGPREQRAAGRARASEPAAGVSGGPPAPPAWRA